MLLVLGQINDFLSINMTGNKSGALLLTIFELSNRRGNLAFTISAWPFALWLTNGSSFSPARTFEAETLRARDHATHPAAAWRALEERAGCAAFRAARFSEPAEGAGVVRNLRLQLEHPAFNRTRANTSYLYASSDCRHLFVNLSLTLAPRIPSSERSSA